MEEDNIVVDIDDDEEVSTRETAKPWEKEIVWESLDQIPSGKLTNAKDIEFMKKLEKRRKHSSQKESAIVRRGLTRYLFLIVDISEAMVDKGDNMRPSRMAVVTKGVTAFIREYFDQNPISQLGLVITRNSVAEKITELSGNPMRHISEFNKVATANNISGEPSLQNALEVCRATLSHVPKYGTREILLIFAGLSTCDPGDIFETITALKKDSIRVSIIGLSAEMYLCRALSTGTSGSYMVALNEEHFNELLFAHTPPPPAVTATKLEASLVRMGFPLRRMNQTTNLKRNAVADELHPSLCAWYVGGIQFDRCSSPFIFLRRIAHTNTPLSEQPSDIECQRKCVSSMHNEIL
eukprot:TRINITY_DN1027_c0_g2_i1.p1 TRINITY_DN1027_c0_g2~~TRINITY_DN1027_c0_g2_i1.p1  ORF type:complete len:352 (-),score=49.68 TRINITY_DN1027_c0_g2_i1:409-1464(-)